MEVVSLAMVIVCFAFSTIGMVCAFGAWVKVLAFERSKYEIIQASSDKVEDFNSTDWMQEAKEGMKQRADLEEANDEFENEAEMEKENRSIADDAI